MTSIDTAPANISYAMLSIHSREVHTRKNVVWLCNLGITNREHPRCYFSVVDPEPLRVEGRRAFQQTTDRRPQRYPVLPFVRRCARRVSCTWATHFRDRLFAQIFSLIAYDISSNYLATRPPVRLKLLLI